MTSTAHAAAGANVLQLAPYIFFYGRCQEALEFYRNVLGGSYEAMRNSDSPMADQVPADWKDKIMHASFTAPGISFMASDGRESKTIDPDAGNIALSLTAQDRAQGERIFNALCDGGSVNMPFSDAFWGGQFGSVNDRFGIEWMVTSP